MVGYPIRCDCGGLCHNIANCTAISVPSKSARGGTSFVSGRRALTVAHQPPASCAQSRCRPNATTSPLHHWPDTITGKCTSPRDPTQAPDPSERGVVGGRLHALVGRQLAARTHLGKRESLKNSASVYQHTPIYIQYFPRNKASIIRSQKKNCLCYFNRFA